MTYAFSRTKMPAWNALVTCGLFSQIREQRELTPVQDKSACCALRTRLECSSVSGTQSRSLEERQPSLELFLILTTAGKWTPVAQYDHLKKQVAYVQQCVTAVCQPLRQEPEPDLPAP